MASKKSTEEVVGDYDPIPEVVDNEEVVNNKIVKHELDGEMVNDEMVKHEMYR